MHVCIYKEYDSLAQQEYQGQEAKCTWFMSKWETKKMTFQGYKYIYIVMDVMVR